MKRPKEAEKGTAREKIKKEKKNRIQKKKKSIYLRKINFLRYENIKSRRKKTKEKTR